MTENRGIINASNIDPEKAFGVLFGSRNDLNTWCPFHEDQAHGTSKSCSVSISGMFKCHSCGAQGTALEYYQQVQGILSTEEALGKIGTTEARKSSKPRAVRPLKDIPNLIPATEHTLHGDRESMTYLTKIRGIHPNIIRKYHIGRDEYRITVPIYNEAGTLVNIRRFAPPPRTEGHPKWVAHLSGDGTPLLYPFSIIDETPYGNEMFIVEGEWDRHLMESQGFSAITNTGNVSTWCDEWTHMLSRYKIRIIYDVNDKLEDLGQRQAWLRASEFLAAGCQDIKVISLPISDVGGDLTDWFMKYKKTAKDLRKLVDETESVTESDSRIVKVSLVEQGVITHPSTSPVTQEISVDNATLVTLHDASDSQFLHKPIRVRCILAGHGTAPFLAPKRVKITMQPPHGDKEVFFQEFSPDDPDILGLINVSKNKQRAYFRALISAPKDAQVSIELLETRNIQELFLIPAIDYDVDQGPYTLRRAFYIGNDLHTNQVYEFIGFTLPDPNTQAATHLFTEARPALTNIDTYTLKEDTYESLKKVFQSDSVHNKIADIASELSTFVTKIYGRADLHTAIDLVFHSPMAFNFAGHKVRKGWLECLIMGDTRTGKGFVTEGLVRHYGVGEVVSGENLTLAGLIGGVQHLGDRWNLVWGKLPLQDRRLVVMDECTGLSINDIGKLSRIRSEGIAEVTKIISEKTTARTRLIWLANPRGGNKTIPRMVADYNYGIECVPELVGAAEDIARFDIALIVAQNEVDPGLINQHRDAPTRTQTYSSKLCRELILWIWSRTPDQIVFDEEVEETALRAANALSKSFTPKVPLVQGEDIRFKLARLAAAVAGRVFSTEDGVTLRVRKEHMEFAYNFLHHIYTKPACGYGQMSAVERERATLKDPAKLWEAISMHQDAAPDLIAGLLEHNTITAQDLCDYADCDIHAARSLISELVRQRAMIKEGSTYRKKPAFKTFLQQARIKLLEQKGES